MKNVSLPESWDEETDVIVIGSGFAGLAAAIDTLRISQVHPYCRYPQTAIKKPQS
jgi:aspartate oxidase